MAKKISIIIVSFNTKHLIDRCFNSVKNSAGELEYEIIVVDNMSKDGSYDHIKEKYPEVKLIQSGGNIGFAAANNLGFKSAEGEYIVLLNSDAFIVEDGLKKSVEKMEKDKRIGLGGVKLIGENGEWQPSARTFPGIFTEFSTISGLSDKYKNTRIFGKVNMTYCNQEEDIVCDWVPGAFSIIRREVIEKIGLFDERFFLYFEEVDLCRRIKKAGYKIIYWADIKVIHIGGGSTTVFSEKLVSKSGMQMTLWRLQSQYLYYRKNYGICKTLCSKYLEQVWNYIRYKKNIKKNPKKAEESKVVLELIKKAWIYTKGGEISPERPWKGE